MDARSRKVFLIISGIIILLAAGWFVWQKYKYKFVENKIVSAVNKGTDQLYIIKYDSLAFDEALGDAYLKNIRIYADTFKLKEMNREEQPYVILDIKIESISISGVATMAAIAVQNFIGDSVLINQPEITVYRIKPLIKNTSIESEARSIYEQILGNLKLVDLDYVFINNARLTGMDFYTKEKNYELVNAKIKLDDILIDSTTTPDPDRVLFCKQAAFTVDTFTTYKYSKKELQVADVNFSGLHRSVIFKSILSNRFDDGISVPKKLLEATDLKLTGIDTDEIIRNKHILVDSILCSNIVFYQPPPRDMEKVPKVDEKVDSTGFMHVYSVFLKHLDFPKVKVVANEKDKYKLGNITIKVNEVEADELYKVQTYPLRYSKEVEVAVRSVGIKSKDNKYDYLFDRIILNSLKKQLRIASFVIKPYTNELAFAASSEFQADRYDVKLNDILLDGIVMDDLLDEKLIASQLIVNKTSARIYRDLTRTLEKKSKVGNYPSQLITGLDMPLKIDKAILKNAYIEYKEKEVVSDSTGIVSFANSTITISNITNIPAAIQSNPAMNMIFDTKALGSIPLKGNFKFFLNSETGNFEVNGTVSKFDALLLNKVYIPMALIRVKDGKVNEINFNLTGNDTSAKGDFVMKYENLKVDVLKRDKDSKEIKKRGLLTFAANLIVKNNNPNNGTLRKEKPEYDRDIYKSFFNLVWKTIFEGMGKTVGLP